MSNTDSLNRIRIAGSPSVGTCRKLILTLFFVSSLSSDLAAEEDPTANEHQSQGVYDTSQPHTFQNGPPLLGEWIIKWYDLSNSERCIDRLIDIIRVKEESTTMYFFDIDCDERVDTRYSQPDDLGIAAHLAVDFVGDDRPDVVVFDVNRDGHIDYSIFDVNDDGTPDLMGYHKNKNPVPFKIEFDEK